MEATANPLLCVHGVSAIRNALINSIMIAPLSLLPLTRPILLMRAQIDLKIFPHPFTHHRENSLGSWVDHFSAVA